MSRPVFRLPWRSARQIEHDVDDELRFHIAMRVEELVARGMTPDAARAEAGRQFGDVEDARRYLRDMDRDIEAARRRRDHVSELRHDVVYALRKLRGAPAFTITALLTLALGIGANTAIFSVVHGVLLKPLPFPHPEQLVRVWSADPTTGTTDSPMSAMDLDDYRAQRQAFADLGGYFYQSGGGSGIDLTGLGDPQRLSAAFVEPGFFPVLQVRPVVGRLPREDEMHRGGPDKVTVLSYAFWQRQFNGETSAVGRTLTLDGASYQVLGVLPRDFRYPGDDVDLYIPYSTITDDAIPRVRENRVLEVVGRLRPGYTIDRGRAEVTAVARRLGEQYAEDRTWSATIAPLHDVVVGKARTGLLVLLGAVAFVLLLACANLASLLLARATTRERELAVRSALGAARGRLVRQLLTESVVLALVGGALGIGVAVLGTRALVALGATQLPRAAEIGLDPTVLAFAIVLSLVVGVVFGLAPALRATALDLQTALREGGRGSTGARGQRARAVLVIGEVAVAVILVVGAGLMTRSFLRLLDVDLGFRHDHVLVVNYSMTAKHEWPVGAANYYAAVLDKVRALPGVVDAGAAKEIPFRGKGERREIVPEGMVLGATAEKPAVNVIHVSDGYFHALGVPVLSGREFRRADDLHAPVQFVVNQAFAKKYFPGRSPVGRTVAIGREAIPILGVVGDIRQLSVEEPAQPVMYIHTMQNPRGNVHLMIRTRGEPLAMARAVREAIWTVDRDQTITAIYTFDSAVGEAVARPRLLTTLLALFGVLGLLIGGIGLYGVLAYLVTNRRREIGVRMALGADAGSVLRMFVQRGLVLAALGLAAGLAGAVVLTRFMQSVLFGIEPTDPVTFVAVALVLLAVACLASWIPARRASRVDPLIAMRTE